MAKVHPKGGKNPSLETGSEASVLTVWKKSLMFSCNGFAVFDSNGDLVFRVDNYMHGNRGQILLMDASGKPLLTIRRKMLSLGDCWVVCEGETALKPQLTVRKRLNRLKSKTLAYATSTCSKKKTYHIQGSYSQRCCVVYDANQRKVCELIRKEGVGDDVFRLVVHSSFQSPIAMALVILLDQMFGVS
ncbi:unnamed protein product [Thlaspi arvense]|uniref:Protein LURP-one-related 8 n=1 Tax=Thlaspi arvense TaxID=13288 RepID=A0AAU9SZS0_THLAR|nr:unnamed protein product [Thlaspi arvense]